MEELLLFFDFFSKLKFLQITCLMLSAISMFWGPLQVKKMYLKRVGADVDPEIEDRNSWILYPKKYSLKEKIYVVFIYLFSFFFIIIALNL